MPSQRAAPSITRSRVGSANAGEKTAEEQITSQAAAPTKLRHAMRPFPSLSVFRFIHSGTVRRQIQHPAAAPGMAMVCQCAPFIGFAVWHDRLCWEARMRFGGRILAGLLCLSAVPAAAEPG